MAKIAIITPWNTICGISEMAQFLVTALENRGHTLTIFANKFAGEYYPVGIRKDGINVHRIFETGFQQNKNEQLWFNVNEFTVRFDADVLLVNYQDYVIPNKRALNYCMQYAREQGAKVYILFHDDCVSPDLEVHPYSGWIVPPSINWNHPQVRHIDQGIPEPSPTIFNLLRIDAMWQIACFGLGRNRTQELIFVVNEINQEHLLDRPLLLFIFIAKPNQFSNYTVSESNNIIIERGYQDLDTLSVNLFLSHACVIWYPDIAQQSTSSAFRFALASRVPIIANRSNWVRDQIGNGCWIEVEKNDRELFKQAIIKTFQDSTYPMLRDQMTRLQEKKIQESGWSKIAEQYEQLF